MGTDVNPIFHRQTKNFELFWVREREREGDEGAAAATFSDALTKFSAEGRGPPGLVVMRGDSCSEGREFESQHPLLDGVLHIWLVVKFVTFTYLERPKINEEEAGDGPFKMEEYEDKYGRLPRPH